MKAIQYTIRGVPQEVDRVLRQKARQRRISLNQVVVEELANASGQAVQRRDLSKFVGGWELDPEFDRIIAEGRKIDPAKWQ